MHIVAFGTFKKQFEDQFHHDPLQNDDCKIPYKDKRQIKTRCCNILKWQYTCYTLQHQELKPAAPGPGLDSPLARHSVPSVAVCTAFFATKGSWTSSEPQLRRSAVCCVSWDFYSFLVCQRVVTGWSRWWIPKSKWTKVNVSERQWTKGNVFVILILYEYLYDLSKFFGPRFCPILMLLRKWGPETPETFWKSVSWPRLWSHVVPFATIKCQLFDVFVSAPEPLRFYYSSDFGQIPSQVSGGASDDLAL